MIKYGLKLWSKNKEWFPKAISLYNEGIIDFIEFFIVPNTLREVEILKEVPIVIHAPHFTFGFNISNLTEDSLSIFKEQVIKTADFFNSEYIIVHAGVGKEQEVFQENVAKLQDKRILIENMPRRGFVASDGDLCFGSTVDDLEFIKKECGLDICFDFSHACSSAFSQGLDYKEYISTLLEKLNPFYFHISGNEKETEQDKHMNLYESAIDIKWMKEKIKDKDIFLVVETPKKDGLKNDQKNIMYLRNL